MKENRNDAMRYTIKAKRSDYAHNLEFKTEKEALQYVKYFFNPICTTIKRMHNKTIIQYIPRSKDVKN